MSVLFEQQGDIRTYLQTLDHAPCAMDKMYPNQHGANESYKTELRVGVTDCFLALS